jgi:nucleoside-diphosphate-sugar epimerase
MKVLVTGSAGLVGSIPSIRPLDIVVGIDNHNDNIVPAKKVKNLRRKK